MRRSKQNILVLVPKETAFGGATIYYKNIQNLFTLNVKYMGRGNKRFPYQENKIKQVLRLFFDFFIFVSSLRKYGLIHINSSLNRKSLLRDAMYMMAASLFNKKIILTFHAWSESVEKRISTSSLSLFRFFFFKSDAIIVLSNRFKSTLVDWGFQKPIYCETTIVNNSFLQGFSEDSLMKKQKKSSESINVLFLARIEKGKGIYEAMDTFLILKKNYSNLKFTVVGDGPELDNVKKHVEKTGLKDIVFRGYLQGEEVIDAYKNADIYFFPSHSEGMPTSVLEAMTLGLPVIARKVGGLNDFFEEDKMGYTTNSFIPADFSKLFHPLLDSAKKREEVGLFNYHYAKNNFIADVVVKRLEKIYMDIIKK